MKKFMKYALICAITLPVFSSCNMLEEDTFGAATVDGMLQNEENVVSLLDRLMPTCVSCTTTGDTGA